MDRNEHYAIHIIKNLKLLRSSGVRLRIGANNFAASPYRTRLKRIVSTRYIRRLKQLENTTVFEEESQCYYSTQNQIN